MIISNGKNTHPMVIFKGMKKNNLEVLFPFCDATDEIKIMARNNAEPKDTV